MASRNQVGGLEICRWAVGFCDGMEELSPYNGSWISEKSDPWDQWGRCVMTPVFLFLRQWFHELCDEVVELSPYDGSWSSWLGGPMAQWGQGEPGCWMLIWQCDLPIRYVAWFGAFILWCVMFVSLLWNRYWVGHIRIIGIVVGGFDYLIWSVWVMVFDNDGCAWGYESWLGGWCSVVLVFRGGMWSCSGGSGAMMRYYWQATARDSPWHLFIPEYFAVFVHSFTSFVFGYNFVWCFEIALFESYNFDVPSRTETATVERWTFVNMFVG